MRWITRIFTCLTLGLCVTGGVGAGESTDQRELVNKAAIGVLGGSISGTYSRMVWDMADAFDDGYDFRIVPILGKGSIKGVEDLLYLQGVDLALLQSDVLDFFASKNILPNLREQLRYITVLYNEEVHLIARDGIETIHDLDGKRVSFGSSSSGQFLTASVIFSQLNIDPEVLDFSNEEGLERLKQGEIDAMIRVVGAPTRLLQDVAVGDQLHFVPIPKIDGAYFASSLTHEQYPALVPAGETVPTMAVGALVAAYNWPRGHARRARIQLFADRLTVGLEQLRKDPYHDKWRQVDPRRELPGWIRWEPQEPPRS